MQCQVELDARGRPIGLRWMPALLGAREENCVEEKSKAIEPVAAITSWRIDISHTYSLRSVELYTWSMAKFNAWLEARGKTLADVNRDLVQTFLAELAEKHKPNSVKCYYKAIRSFFAWAEDKGGIPNPVGKVKAPKVPSPSDHLRDPLSDDEVVRLLDGCAGDVAGLRDRAMISLLAYTSMRQVALSRIELGDIETRDGRTLIWVWEKGRTGKDKFKVVPAPAEEDLRAWLAARPGPASGPMWISLRRGRHHAQLSLNAIRIIITRRMRAAGMKTARKSTHSLRHAALTNAIRNGAGLLNVMEMAGHEDVQTTMGYVHTEDRILHPAEDFIVYRHPKPEEKPHETGESKPPADRRIPADLQPHARGHDRA